MIETDLYFGQSRPDGSIISANEWDHFKSHQIAPLFKEGCTIVNTTGTWLDPVKNQLITEPTYVVIYFYKKSQKISGKIDSLRSNYRLRFQQQSVLRIDKKVNGKF